MGGVTTNFRCNIFFLFFFFHHHFHTHTHLSLPFSLFFFTPTPFACTNPPFITRVGLWHEAVVDAEWRFWGGTHTHTHSHSNLIALHSVKHTHTHIHTDPQHDQLEKHTSNKKTTTTNNNESIIQSMTTFLRNETHLDHNSMSAEIAKKLKQHIITIMSRSARSGQRTAKSARIGFFNHNVCMHHP